MVNVPPIAFAYLPSFPHGIVFTNTPCLCGGLPALDAGYFDVADDREGVCLACLQTGTARVHIPHYLKAQLYASIEALHPTWHPAEVQADGATKLDQLCRTPPLPWIQENEWPVRDGDFCAYVGEWRPEDFARHAPDGDGRRYFAAILDDAHNTDTAYFWESLQLGWTTAFVFLAPDRSTYVAVIQSF